MALRTLEASKVNVWADPAVMNETFAKAGLTLHEGVVDEVEKSMLIFKVL